MRKRGREREKGRVREEETEKGEGGKKERREVGAQHVLSCCAGQEELYDR